MSPRLFVLSILLAAAVAGAEADPAQPPLPPNAALKYWLAWVLLPAADAEKKIDALWDHPQGDDTTAWLGSCSTSLRFVHAGAAIRQCDWGLLLEDGPGALLPHLSKMRSLGRVVRAAAHANFERKSYAAAYEGTLDLLALSRHAGADGMLIGKMVEVAIANMGMELLASYLPVLPPETLKSLRGRLAALPPSATFADTVREEQRSYGDYFRKQVPTMSAPERDHIAATILGENVAADDKIFMHVAMADNAVLTEALAALDEHYTVLIAAMALPAAEQKAALAQLDVRAKTANPFVRLFPPMVMGCYKSVAAHKVRMTLLLVAADIVAAGPEAVTKHKDPFGDGPFGYRKLDVGFELTSQLTDRDAAPVRLSVGVPLAGPAPARNDAVFPPRPPLDHPGEF